MGDRDQESTLFVGNLDNGTSDEDVFKVFEKYGGVKEGRYMFFTV